MREHVLLISVDDLLLNHLLLDIWDDNTLIMLAHDLVSVLLELIISVAEPLLLQHLSLRVFGHETPIFLLLQSFYLLLQMACLIVDSTCHNILLPNEVSLSLLHFSNEVSVCIRLRQKLTVHSSLRI